MLKAYINKINIYYFILFFLLVAVTLSFSTKDYNFILIKEVILITGTVFFLPAFLLRKDYSIKKIAIYPFILILWLLCSFFFSKFKYAGISILLLSIVCFILFFLITHIDLDYKKISDIIILSFIPSLIIGLIQVFSPEKMRIFMVFGDRIPSTSGNPNFFGAYISAVIPFIINRFFTTKNLYYKASLFFVFVISFILIFFTGSKSALFALVTGMSVFVFIKYKNFINKMVLAPILVLTVILSAFFIINTYKTFEQSFFFRNQVWRGTIKIIKDNFISGTGPGSFSAVFPEYRPAELMKWTYEHSYEVSYPENIFLQIGAETGITGLIIFLFFLYFVFKFGIISPPEYISGAVAILTTNFFGVDINYAPSLFLFIIITAMIIKNSSSYYLLSPFLGRFLIIASFIFIIFVSSFWIRKHISGIYTKTGVYFSKRGNFNTAIEYYKTAIGYYNKNLEALYFMGSSYYDSGDYENALKIFKNISKLSPHYVLLHYKIARIYNERGLYEAAIDEYNKMLKIDPYLKEALVDLAYIYYNKKNNFDDAEKCLLKALEKYKDDPALLSNLGNIYFMTKRLNESIECFKKAIAIKEDKDYYYNLGSVYFTMNDILNAKLYLKKAERIAPADEKIREMLRLVEKYERMQGKRDN